MSDHSQEELERAAPWGILLTQNTVAPSVELRGEVVSVGRSAKNDIHMPWRVEISSKLHP